MLYLIKGNNFNKNKCLLYLEPVKGEIGYQQLTDKEIRDGFHKAIWVTLDEAIRLLEQDNPCTYIGKFMRARDLVFLKETKKFLTKNDL